MGPCLSKPAPPPPPSPQRRDSLELLRQEVYISKKYVADAVEMHRAAKHAYIRRLNRTPSKLQRRDEAHDKLRCSIITGPDTPMITNVAERN